MEIVWYIFAGVGVLIFIGGLFGGGEKEDHRVAPLCSAHRDDRPLTKGEPREMTKKSTKTWHKPKPSKRRQPRAPIPAKDTIFQPKALPKNQPGKRR